MGLMASALLFPSILKGEENQTCRAGQTVDCGATAPQILDLAVPSPGVAKPEMSSVVDAPLHLKLQRQFFDDFIRFSPDHSGWRHHYNHGRYDEFRGRTLQANKEQQVYVDPGFAGTGDTPLGLNPFDIREGVLSITGSRASSDAMPYLDGFEYTSGLISSQNTFEQTYGYFEARMKVPIGQGLWSAFWLKTHHAHTPKGLPAWPPEIDIMEFIGTRPDRYYTTVHWDVMPNNKKSGSEISDVKPGADFNTYGVLWTPDQTVFYFNRQPVKLIETKPNHNVPMFMVLNLALGGKWPGNVSDEALPARLEIDWVAAYQISPDQKIEK
ncbi:glycoside hydrolase family 16 protein [Roseovarius sp. Pro17]|uniref:glycoside hydrolase family 16 protein n=1 Tax=Roseovarius sp. Pro17 TaxID=3108175 RepID=UPI002D781C90|nr:glycoside hydrolase family 16 protein [Roseovarius sp. Pro17]